VRAGDGGNGAVSFRREKYVPFGGPDGGNGGRGGDVVVVADMAVSNLKAFVRKRAYQAENGGGGAGQRMQGKNGSVLELRVPPGTVVSEMAPEGEPVLLADLEAPGQSVNVVTGGRGGAGNAHFATATHQAPDTAKKGLPGEEKALLLELRVIADIGIVGLPNAGKSSLLAAVSAADPRIAPYPFTTREPILGVVEVKGQVFVLAEIPGLIAGAHTGRGLGHEFLRHVARTRMLIHLVDGGAPSPLADLAQVDRELALFDPALADKPQIVAVNKIDLPEVVARLPGLTEELAAAGVRAFFVSAATGAGVKELMAEAARRLKTLPKPEVMVPRKVFRPEPAPARRRAKPKE
jgi:GTP-binding protein